jgi:hypothetical protein
MANTNNNVVSGWVGWIGFASFLLLFTGFFHVIEGIADLARHTVFVHAGGNVWVLDYNKWGWINIVGGILLITAATSLMKGGLWGRIFASFVLVISMLVSVGQIPIYPIWSILILIVDAFILYAITVHGNEVKKLS